MNKKFSLRKTLLIIVLGALVASAIGISVMSVSKYNLNAETFADDGYMLLATKDKSSESINEQHYFNAGESYRKTIDDTIVFTDINGTKVNAEQENFVHYQSGSMNALAETVVLDTDHVDQNEQVSYYSVPEKTTLVKNGSQYTINNAGNNINLTNIVWKISNDRYMIVSPTINLVISEESEQNFTDYVELRYIDEGVVHLVTQDGTYSTVSSDAYLELKNGVRIYIGSKNISDGENILMNMSQMVVGSDDNIEVIPDEDYTIENEDQPQIVINASDGEDGETGLDGEKGENGGNRADGSDGKSGVPGDPGNSAPNANVIFEPEVMPIFKDLELDTKPYGVTETMTYNANTCIVNDAWVSIVDVTTGNEVWKKNIYDKLPADPSITMEEIECDTLKANTQYRLNVHARYSSPNYPDQIITQILAQELFYTDSYGFSLTKKAITSNSIELNLNKDLEAGVNTLRVRLFKENQEEFGYYDPTDLSIHPVDEFHSFEVYSRKLDTGESDEKLAVGDSVPVIRNGLESNTVYYAQIQIMSLDESSGEGTTPTIVPTNSYPKQKYITKKLDPILDKPSVIVDESSKSFIVYPGNIIDKDNGITGYRLEVYRADDYGNENAKPCYEYDVLTPSITNISIPIASSSDSGKEEELHELLRNKEYYAHIVAIFNDNEETVDFRSPRSDKFLAGEGKGPSVRFEFDNDYITASTAEGKIIITDTSSDEDKHTFPENSRINVMYIMNTTTSDDILNDKGNVIEFKEDSIPISMFHHEDFEYSYPISMKSLKANTEYRIVVYSSEFYIDGVRHGDPLEFEYVDEDSFKTKPEYSPLLVKSNNVRETSTDYSDTMFALSLQFAPSKGNDEESYREYKDTIVPGLGNLGDLSIRSTTILKLDLYVGVGEQPDKPMTYLKTAYVKDRNNWKKNGVEYKPTYIETANLDNDKTIKPIYGDSEYGYVYPFNTSLYNDSYSFNINDTNTINDENSSLIITDAIFTDETSNINPMDKYDAGTQFFIRVSAYDYTYGLGDGYNINGKDNNKIKVGIQDDENKYVVNSNEDAWITFNKHYAVPPISQELPYSNNYLRLGTSSNNVKQQFVQDPTYYEDPSDTKIYNIHLSNLQNAKKDGFATNKDLLENLWNTNGIADATDVGITYCGPKEMARYCASDVESVKYNVYKKVYSYNSETDMYDCTEVPVNTSGWIKYVYSDTNTSMPTYTFFYDIIDKDTNLSISRGEEYIIETQLKLKGYDSFIYPNYWHEETETLPGDDGVNEHTYRIFDELLSKKQVPQIVSMPYSGNVNDEAENSDEIYMIMNDPDFTLVSEDSTDFEKVKVFKGVFDTEGKPDSTLEEVFGTVSGIVDIDGVDEKISVVKGNLYNSGNALLPGNLYVKYTLTEKDKLDENYSSIMLISEENVTKSKAITLIDKTTETEETEIEIEDSDDIVINDSTYKDFEYEWDNSFVTIDFNYQTVNKEDKNGYNDLLGVDVVFNRYIYNDPTCRTSYSEACKLVPDTTNTTMTLFVKPVYMGSSQSAEGEFTHKARINIDAIDASDIIKESDAVGIKLKAYYDTGEYGIKYFDSSKKDENSTDYYLIQYANRNGSAAIPTDQYPINYYDTHIKEGVISVKEIDDNTQPELSNINTPLFSKDDVTYLLSENKISSGEKDFNIENVGLYDVQTSSGYPKNAIIKNVGADVTEELVTDISFIKPVAKQTGIKTGYSTAVLDFKVFSSDIVLKTDKNITIEYKMKNKGDQTDTWHSKTVAYNPSRLDEETDDRYWSNIYLEGLKHYIDDTSTEYEYRIKGFANDGTAEGLEQIMYVGAFKVNHYEHLDGNVIVETYGSPKTRNSKRLSYTLNFKNIITKDIKNSINSIDVEVYDNESDALSGSGTIVSSINLPIGTIFDNSLDEYLSTYSYNAKLDWSPMTDKSHEMNDDKAYWIRVKYNYSDGDFDHPVTYKYFSLGNDSDSSIIGWNKFYNLKSYVITGDKQVEVLDKDTSPRIDYQLKFNFAGRDTNRLQPIASNGKLTFLVELCDDKNNVVRINNEKVVDPNTVYTEGDVYQRRLITDVSIGNDGSFKTAGMNGVDTDGNPIDNPLLTFKHLNPGEEYYLNMYFILDGQNINISEITNNLSLDSDLIETKEIIEGLEPLNPAKGSGVYKIQSIKIRTETSENLRVDAAILHPESHEAFILGTNMNFVQRIRYTVNKDGIDISTVTIPHDKLSGLFRQEQYSSDLYYLTIPDLLQDGAKYIIRIDFYGYDGTEWDNPSTTALGVYGIEE